MVLLGPDGRQSAHAPGARPAAGEVALAPPLLGASQRLLNRAHFAVYFEVGPAAPGISLSLPFLRLASARHDRTMSGDWKSLAPEERVE